MEPQNQPQPVVQAPVMQPSVSGPVESNNKKILELIAVMTVLALVAGILFFVARRAMNSSSNSNTTTAQQETYPSPTGGEMQTVPTTAMAPQAVVEGDNAVRTNKGVLTVSTKDGRTNYTVGEPITLVFKATAQSEIFGYDVVLPLPMNVQVVSKTPISTDFQYFQTVDKKNLLYGTGTKKLSVKTPVMLSDTPLFELTIQSSTAGRFAFMPTFTKIGATTDSNLIDNNSHDVLGQTAGITVTVN